VPFTITSRNVILTGLLADGSTFSFNLNSSDSNSDFFATGAMLAVALGVAGDFNHNGSVDAADYTLWRNSIGRSGASLAADANGDNQIDASDYAVWKANFGRRIGGGAGASAASPVPEPAALALLLTAITVFFYRRESTPCREFLPLLPPVEDPPHRGGQAWQTPPLLFSPAACGHLNDSNRPTEHAAPRRRYHFQPQCGGIT
jgi:Dockerin type I domain